ncbi:hypothetical protein LguiA_005684 [Lonicera macranthoides]
MADPQIHRYTHGRKSTQQSKKNHSRNRCTPPNTRSQQQTTEYSTPKLNSKIHNIFKSLMSKN